MTKNDKLSWADLCQVASKNIGRVRWLSFMYKN